MAAHPTYKKDEHGLKSDGASIASSDDQDRNTPGIDKCKQELNLPPIAEYQELYTAAKPCGPNCLLALFDHTIQKGGGSNPDPREELALKRLRIDTSEPGIQDSKSDIPEYVAHNGGVSKECHAIIGGACTQGYVTDEVFEDKLRRESTHSTLESVGNDTSLMEVGGAFDRKTRAPGEFGGDPEGHTSLYELASKAGPSTTRSSGENLRLAQLVSLSTSHVDADVARETMSDAQSVCSSADCYGTLDYDNDNDDRPTLPTTISEGVPNPDDDADEGDGSESEGSRTHKELLPDLMLASEVSLGKATSDQCGTEIETETGAIDLRKAEAPPREDATDALYEFKKVEDSLNNNSNISSYSKTQVDLVDSIFSINIGFCDYIPRWKPGSTVTFHICRQSFPRNTPYADHTAKSSKIAADAWNEGEVGVTLKQVADGEPATFGISYADKHPINPSTLAVAFLPVSNHRRQQPRLVVYSLAFDKNRDHYNHLFNVLCHELGHILGARHWDVGDESMWPSVEYGLSDPSSVMNHRHHPRDLHIQTCDYEELKAFYAYKGTHYRGLRIVDVEP
ncbi:hypothetical protein Hte_009564 [Hypoxylon texense]